MRRRSLRKRSPSPPSPRTRKDVSAGSSAVGLGLRRKPSLAGRSTSSENVLNVTAGSGGLSPTMPGAGSLTASAEGLVRTLRTFRQNVASATSRPSPLHVIPADTLRELDTELSLLKDMLAPKLGHGEGGNGTTAGGMSMERVLEEASERIVSRLDERIRERVEGELRRSAGEEASTAGCGQEQKADRESDGNGGQRTNVREKDDDGDGPVEAVVGAMAEVKI